MPAAPLMPPSALPGPDAAVPAERVAGELRLAEAAPGEPVHDKPALGANAVLVMVAVTLSTDSPGESADHAAEPAPGSPNGANAPADNPEHADTLPARALRPDLSRRGDEVAPEDAVAEEADADEEEPSTAAGASASEGASCGTPGMSQPGSVIAASLRQDTSPISTAHTFDYSCVH